MLKKIALIPMACKPFHKGHANIVEIASQENDEVICFISKKNRIIKKEIPIYANTANQVIKDFIIPKLNKNIQINFIQSPVSYVWEYIDQISKNYQNEIYSIYGDEIDNEERFNKDNLQKYAKLLYSRKAIIIRSISRTETDCISGTEMRFALSIDDFNKFHFGLPKFISKDEAKQIWNLFKSDIQSYHTDCKLNQHILTAIQDVYTICPSLNEWIEIKKLLIPFLNVDLRSFLSKHNHIDYSEHTNIFDRKIIEEWEKLSGKPVIFNYDG